MSERPSTASAIAVLLVALLAVSHGSIFVRVADAHPFVISAFRVGIAAAVVVPLALALRWRELTALSRRTLLYSAGAGCFLAVHFVTWISSLNYTSIANSTVLVTLNPVWIAIVMTIATRHRPRGMVIASVGLSVAGGAIIGYGSAGAGGSSLFGDGLALLGGMCAAGYLMLGRLARRNGISLLSYLALCYGISAGLLWALVLVMKLPITGLSNETYAAMIAMALLSQLIGHGGYNWSLKLFSPGFVAVCLLGEPILASIFGLLYFGEAIPVATLVGAPVIMCGIYLGARAELR
ncbi:MAG: DMT family transporter [Rhodospirillales bacterium]|nr:DMT family transporter [Rhodospirillales bacterium]